MGKCIQNISVELDEFLASYHNIYGGRKEVLNHILIGDINFLEEFERWLRKEGIEKSVAQALGIEDEITTT